MSIGRTEFTSGLRVITERMPGVRSVTLGFWVLAGSRDEPPPISGSSHFLEHLLFKGTKTRSARDIAEAFDAVGGELNAFTAKEYTAFYARVRDRDLPMAVDHLADMLQHSVLRAADLDAERQVILEEINQHEDDPGDLVHDLFTETLWPGHPLGRPILGTKQSIQGAGRDQVRRFYRKHYVAGNVVVVAAGNLRHEELLELVAEHMEPGAVRAEGPSAWNLRTAGDPPSPSGRSLSHAQGRAGPQLRRTTPVASTRTVRVRGGEQRARRRDELPVFPDVRRSGGSRTAVLLHSMYSGRACRAYAGTTPARAKEVLAIMRAQLEDVANKGLGPDEFERAKGHMKGSLVLSLEDPGGRMSRLGKSEIGHGETLTVNQLLGRIEAVTPEDAARAAERVLSQPMTVTVLGPFSSKDVIA